MKTILMSLGMVGGVAALWVLSHMAVNCTVCGVSMAVAEESPRWYDNAAGSYHHDCGYISYMENSGPASQMPAWKASITKHKTKLIAKHNGTSGEY